MNSSISRSRMTARQCLEHEWLRTDDADATCSKPAPTAAETTPETCAAAESTSEPTSAPRMLTPASDTTPSPPPQVLIRTPADHAAVHRTPVGDSPVVHRRAAEKMISMSPPSDVDLTTGRVVASPFGSPVGTRRALTPSPDGALDTAEEPSKRCKCASSSSLDGGGLGGSSIEVDVSSSSSHSFDVTSEAGDNKGSVDLPNGIGDLAVDTKENNNSGSNGRFLTVQKTTKKTKLVINRTMANDVEKENTPMSKEH